ncbi:hypothetical protein L1887_13637 [Cichorium endivia]|nr:hypothetical protein L1887_13637 [Cichorium endivia]
MQEKKEVEDLNHRIPLMESVIAARSTHTSKLEESYALCLSIPMGEQPQLRSSEDQSTYFSRATIILRFHLF